MSAAHRLWCPSCCRLQRAVLLVCLDCQAVLRQNLQNTPLCSMLRLPAECHALHPWRCRLKEAGAVLIAKLVSGEMAYYDVWFDGFTKNPWNLLEGSSGSSAGVAAVFGCNAQPAAT